MDTNQLQQENSRTHYEACMDVMYGIRFNDMNERFYRRLDGIFSTAILLGGSAIFVNIFTGYGVMSGIIGLIIAVITYIDREIRPAEKAIFCSQYRAKYGELASVMGSLSLNDIDTQLRKLQANGPATIESLSIPAHQANLLSHGFNKDTRFKPSFLGKIACLLT